MSCEGKTVKLCEIADVIMGQSPKSEYYNTEGNGLPFFQGCSEFGEMYPTVKKYCSKPNRIAQKGDVLMSVRAPIGTLNLADRQCCIGRGLCAIRSKSANRFVYYLLKTNLDMIQTYGSGTIFRAINKAETNNLPFTVPSLPTQHKIAAILSAYDDLIENNLRRINILEEMAQNLYREWFVKFRFPGHENVRMVDSPLGKIPEGWEVGSIGDICQVLTGFAFKSKDWSENGIPVIKIKNILPGNLVETEQVDHVAEDIIEQKHEKYYLKNGDFLIAMTGATAGKVGKLRTSKQTALNQRVAKIEPTDGFYQYVWCRISNPEAEKEFYRLADGAAQPNMSSSQIEGVSLLIPSSEVRGQFAMIVSPILQQVDNLIFQNTTLRQTRDLLLPKLISGELDVSDLDIKTGGHMQ